MSSLVITGSRLYRYKGEHGLDVTRKSGRAGLIWAPSANLVFPALKAFKTAPNEAVKAQLFDEFRASYIAEMRSSYRRDLDAWLALMSRNDMLVLLCYCVDARYCHRSILGRCILPRVCARHGISGVWKPE